MLYIQFILPRYDDPFLHKFNLALLSGFAFENVKVTSKTQLINPYPKYLYFNIGTQLEFNMSDHLGILASFRQYYALNGSQKKLGNWKYDYSNRIKVLFMGYKITNN